LKVQIFPWQNKIVLQDINYQKVVNWVSGEFDLFQQDYKEGLKIYCPNGFIHIKKKENTNLVTALIKSKSSYSGTMYQDKLNFVLGLLKNYNQQGKRIIN